MFYKHWKKIALALASFFWASCGGDGSSEEISAVQANPSLYGVIGPIENDSSDVTFSSSSVEESSSSDFILIALDYGVPYDPDDRDTIYTDQTLCFNDSVQNVEGRVFKIIDCIDGNKYLRNPGDAGSEGVELPEGIQVFAPKAGSEKAPNCTSDQDICIERDPSKPIEQDSLAGCHPIINCPAKPDDTTFIKVE
ncbi:hypothetical protein [Fibrobacter sp. UWB10]|uniref:hypothetical protein n=1 Tax=Fibrobacter sp. UWB10 TaxID=1896201 RepID=UPI0024034E37|nr:hypothetical protein [Fibrobacter sp. UWB10]SMP37853.1 hypothetical protein SAMN05720465_0085 [Fibrobacter sp. UWB10]